MGCPGWDAPDGSTPAFDASRIIMIQGFRDKATAFVFSGGVPRGMARGLAAIAHRKLAAVDAAWQLETPRSPPGNRLETARGDRSGYHSIRINGQWRLVFPWRDDGARAVEIVDCH